MLPKIAVILITYIAHLTAVFLVLLVQAPSKSRGLYVLYQDKSPSLELADSIARDRAAGLKESPWMKGHSSVTVQVINGEQKGSGIVIRDKGKRLWIATNRHVVGDSKNVCIVLSNGKSIPGSVFYVDGSPYDLAFVSVAGLSPNSAYASPDHGFNTTSVNAIVATGYRAETDSYVETLGVTVPILEGRLLQSGYSLTYSNQVEKGMSGGGIFTEDGLLIGMNALHSDPLWSGDWYDLKKRKIDGSLSRKLDSVSVGLSIQTVYLELERALTDGPILEDKVATTCSNSLKKVKD